MVPILTTSQSGSYLHQLVPIPTHHHWLPTCISQSSSYPHHLVPIFTIWFLSSPTGSYLHQLVPIPTHHYWVPTCISQSSSNRLLSSTGSWLHQLVSSYDYLYMGVFLLYLFTNLPTYKYMCIIRDNHCFISNVIHFFLIFSFPPEMYSCSRCCVSSS
jgi:hypothetical protein